MTLTTLALTVILAVIVLAVVIHGFRLMRAKDNKDETGKEDEQ